MSNLGFSPDNSYSNNVIVIDQNLTPLEVKLEAAQNLLEEQAL
jgi:hypothetical protein